MRLSLSVAKARVAEFERWLVECMTESNLNEAARNEATMAPRFRGRVGRLFPASTRNQS